MTELRNGTSVTPTLRLLRPLGQGGMGRVWVAEHLTLGSNVVVKFMSKDIAASLDGASRFAREASVAAAVKSPHVVQVYDHGVTDEGDAYIVMELLEGRDLAAHLSAHGPMTPADVAALVAQVAKALGKAHQVGVVHRDIKPDNIFLCDGGDGGDGDGDGDGDGGELFVKLLDFGIAKSDRYGVSGTATTTGAVVGTPYYMSPEQIVGEKDIDARTDIWSLGVVAFEAMTGRRPFEGTTVGAITLAIHTATRRITDHVPSAPPALDAWFARACARDPKERFQTPREAARALQQAVGDLAPAATPLLRAPMLSMAGDGSDPHLDSDIIGKSSSADAFPDSRAATHLSSVFPVPARTPRSRPLIVALAVAAVVVLVVFVIPALVRPTPRAVATSSGASSAAALAAPTSLPTPPSAAATGANEGADDAAAGTALAPSTTPSASAGPTAAATTTTARAAAGPTAPATGASTAASTGGALAGTRPTTPTTSTPAKPPTKPTKPGRTRDDDDIK